MNLTPLTTLISMALALSMAVERVIEVLKGIFPNVFAKAWSGDKEFLRCAILRLLSALVGAAVACFGKIDILKIISGHDTAQSEMWLSCLVAGFLAAGGSAFWNHLLDIIKATKVSKETDAKKQSGASVMA